MSMYGPIECEVYSVSPAQRLIDVSELHMAAWHLWFSVDGTMENTKV